MNIQQFDYSTNLLQVVLWQYDQATNILSLLNSKQNWYNINQTNFWENWYGSVFNLSNPDLTISTDPKIQTEVNFGLAVWSIILNVPLFVATEGLIDTEVWGFNAFDPTFPDLVNENVNFTNGPFYFGPVINLTPAQQQFLLLLKYYNTFTRGNVADFPAPDSGHWKPENIHPESYPYLNRFDFPIQSINTYMALLLLNLGSLIGYSGTIWCEDNLNMSVNYIFSDNFPTPLLQAITTLDLWPRPAGVKINYTFP